MSSYRDNAKPSEAEVWMKEALARIESENSAYIKSIEKQILDRIYSHISVEKSHDREIKFPLFVEAYVGRRIYEREVLATKKAVTNLNQIGWSISGFHKDDKVWLRVNIKLTDSQLETSDD